MNKRNWFIPRINHNTGQEKKSFIQKMRKIITKVLEENVITSDERFGPVFHSFKR